MFPDPAASKLINNIKKVFDTGRNLSLDEMIIIQGKETYNNSSLNPIKNEQGEVVAVVGVVRDITEKKVLENELLEKKEELEIIFDYIPAWIFYKDTKNQFIKVNKTFAVAMEKTKEELEGKNLSNFYPKEQVDAFWKDDKEIIETSKPKMGIIESIDTPNGLRWVRTDKIPFKDKNGNILGIIGFTADITEIKLAEATVQKKMMELESMNKLMLNRELKMIELKKEIEELEKKKLV
jgi:PAS domain S-box-containing protein